MRNFKPFNLWSSGQIARFKELLEERDKRDLVSLRNHFNKKYMNKKASQTSREYYYKEMRHAEIDLCYLETLMRKILAGIENGTDLHFARIIARAMKNNYDKQTKQRIIEEAFFEHRRSVESLKTLWEEI